MSDAETAVTLINLFQLLIFIIGIVSKVTYLKKLKDFALNGCEYCHHKKFIFQEIVIYSTTQNDNDQTVEAKNTYRKLQCDNCKRFYIGSVFDVNEKMYYIDNNQAAFFIGEENPPFLSTFLLSIIIFVLGGWAAIFAQMSYIFGF